MLGPLANGFVLVVFGFIIGTLFSLWGHLTGLADIPDKVGKEGFWAGILRRQREEERLMAHAPRTANLTIATTYVFVGVLVLLLIVSPVQWRWIPFLASFAAGFLGMELFFGLAKYGRFKSLDRFVSRLLGEKGPTELGT
jgi:hypothetical protein